MVNSRMVNMADEDEISVYKKWHDEYNARVHSILNDEECVAALRVLAAKGHRRDSVHAAYSVVKRNTK